MDAILGTTTKVRRRYASLMGRCVLVHPRGGLPCKVNITMCGPCSAETLSMAVMKQLLPCSARAVAACGRYFFDGHFGLRLGQRRAESWPTKVQFTVPDPCPRCCQVKTVEGSVDLKVPSGTQPGTTLVMAKRGVPRLGSSNVRGDHQVSRCSTVSNMSL